MRLWLIKRVLLANQNRENMCYNLLPRCISLPVTIPLRNPLKPFRWKLFLTAISSTVSFPICFQQQAHKSKDAVFTKRLMVKITA